MTVYIISSKNFSEAPPLEPSELMRIAVDFGADFVAQGTTLVLVEMDDKAAEQLQSSHPKLLVEKNDGGNELIQ